MKRKIAIVQPYIPRYRMPLFEQLGQDGEWTIHVIADIEAPNQLNQYREFVSPNAQFKVTHVPVTHVGPFTLRPGLERAIEQLDPDATIFTCNPRDIGQYRLMRKHRQKKRLLGLWGMFYRIGKRRAWSEYVMREMGHMASRVFCYGERDTKEMITRGIDREKLVTLHNAIDHSEAIAARECLSADEIDGFRRRNAIEGKRVLLQVVRIYPIKRTDLLLRMFARLVQSRDDVELVLIGGGPDEQAMKRLARELSVSDNVRFLGPIYDETELSLWFSSADLFVIATCAGFSLHHAMCHGLPAVTDDSVRTQTSESEALVDEVTGLRYRAGDVDDFSRKVCRILDDSEFASTLSRNAIERITRHYTLDSMAERFRAGIHEILKAA